MPRAKKSVTKVKNVESKPVKKSMKSNFDELHHISKTGKINAEDVNEITRIIVDFTAYNYGIEEKGIGERLLKAIGEVIDIAANHDRNSSVLFSQNVHFITSLIETIKHYKFLFGTLQFRTDDIKTSFTSHYCYELTILILLGLIDQSACMKAFVKTMDMTSVVVLTEALGDIMIHDLSYNTQVYII